MILAPVVRGRKGEYKKELEKLQPARASCGRASTACCAVARRRDHARPAASNHTIEVVVDRLLIKPGLEQRLEASIQTATKLADGLVTGGGGERRRAALFAEAGLPGLRHQRCRTWSRGQLLFQ